MDPVWDFSDIFAFLAEMETEFETMKDKNKRVPTYIKSFDQNIAIPSRIFGSVEYEQRVYIC